MKLYKQVIQELEDNKKKRENNEIIAIPWSFNRLSNYLPGIVRGRYNIVTANQKVNA